MNFNRLSISLLLLGLVGCKYPSIEQAEIACEEWKEKGETGSFRNQNQNQFNSWEYLEASSRYCSQGILVNQYLGRESKKVARLIKEGKIEEVYNLGEQCKVVKRFRFGY